MNNRHFKHNKKTNSRNCPSQEDTKTVFMNFTHFTHNRPAHLLYFQILTTNNYSLTTTCTLRILRILCATETQILELSSTYGHKIFFHELSTFSTLSKDTFQILSSAGRQISRLYPLIIYLPTST